MITLSLKEGGAVLGTIDEAEFKLLVDQLVEETDEDTDYYVDAATIDMLESAGAGAHLVGLLRKAVGGSEGVDIAWQET